MTKFPHEITEIRVRKDYILVDITDRGAKVLDSGIILLDDDMSESGIRPRYAQVLAVGDEVEGINPGDFVLLDHGDWTKKLFDHTFEDGTKRGVWMTSFEKCLMVSSEEDHVG